MGESVLQTGSSAAMTLASLETPRGDPGQEAGSLLMDQWFSR